MDFLLDHEQKHLSDIKKLNEFLMSEHQSSNEDSSDSSDSEDNCQINITDDRFVLDNLESTEFIENKIKDILKEKNSNESVLALNKFQQTILIYSINKYVNLLEECQKKKKHVKQQIDVLERFHANSKKVIFYKLGVPFFKDTSMRFPPPNLDIIKKKENHEISLVDLPLMRLWVKSDKEILLEEVQIQSKKIRLDRIKKEIQTYTSLIEHIDEKQKTELISKIDKLNTKVLVWKKKEPHECLFPVNERDIEIDWLKISATNLCGRHEDDECRAIWYMYLHPDINKISWSIKENQKLIEIAKEHNFQDWEKIAEKLGTSRSAYQCCLQYHLKLNKKHNSEKWTPEEDAYLLEVVDSCKIGNYIPWGKVSYYIKGRTKNQIYMRYTYTLISGIKKGKFTKTEDALLLKLVKKYGTEFSKISFYLPNRTAVQLRDRYKMVLQFDKKTSGPWSLEEDQQIVKHVREFGENKWSELFKKFNSKFSRNRANLRHRWNTLKRFMEQNPGADLKNAPRRQINKRMKTRKKTSCISKLRDTSLVNSDENNTSIGIDNLDRNDVITENFNNLNIDNTDVTYINQEFIHFFLKIYKFFKTKTEIEDVETDIIHINFILRSIHANLDLYPLKTINSKNLNEYEKMFLHKSSQLISVQIWTFLNIFGNDLISFVPESLFNLDSFKKLISNCKLLLKSVQWEWYNSELENYCKKVNSRYQVIKSEKNDFTNSSQMETEVNTCDMAVKKFVTFHKIQSEDMFKRRFISFFTLPCFKKYIVQLLQDYQKEIESINNEHGEVNIKPIDKKETSNKNKRKRGRPQKIVRRSVKSKNTDQVSTSHSDNVLEFQTDDHAICTVIIKQELVLENSNDLAEKLCISENS